jgi:hypothetical protein
MRNTMTCAGPVVVVAQAELAPEAPLVVTVRLAKNDRGIRELAAVFDRGAIAALFLHARLDHRVNDLTAARAAWTRSQRWQRAHSSTLLMTLPAPAASRRALIPRNAAVATNPALVSMVAVTVSVRLRSVPLLHSDSPFLGPGLYVEIGRFVYVIVMVAHLLSICFLQNAEC